MARKNYLQLEGEEWQKARMQALVRDGFCCQADKLGISSDPCSETCLQELQVHHIRMRVSGGTHDLDNLITLCRVHHEKLHPWMKKCFPKNFVTFQKILPEL